ncbi:MAG: Ig-like domain-containing protein [Lysobacteraceae bacterium]
MAEGDGATTTFTFTVSIDATSASDVTFDYATADGSATLTDNDYVEITTTAGSITAGNLSTTIDVTVNGDTTLESDETFTVELSNVVGANVTTAVGTGTIQDDDGADLIINEIDYDQPGTDAAEFIEIKNVSASPVDLSLYEVVLVNGSGGVIYGTFNPSGMLAPGGYYVICADAANTPSCDLDVTPDTNLMQNGAPDAVAIRLAGSGAIEDAVSYEGSTAGATEGTGVDPLKADSNSIDFIGISRFPDGSDTNDNDTDFAIRCITPGQANVAADTACPPPSVAPQLSISDASANEGNGPGNDISFDVTLDIDASAEFTVTYAIVDGTATVADSDYDNSGSGGTITFTGGTAGTVNIIVPTIGDTTPELDEDFTVVISNVSAGNAVIADDTGVGTIINDDAAIPMVTISDATALEGNALGNDVAFDVTLDINASAEFSVTYTIVDGTATTADSDYDNSGSGGTITFTGGTAGTQQIVVPTIGDTDYEGDETFTVVISNVSAGNAVIVDDTGIGTIQNDDVLLIGSVQGNGDVSPYVGQTVTLQGTVTAIDATGSGGFWIQDDGDGDPDTSDGIYIFEGGTHAALSLGNIVSVTGSVSEYFNLTEIAFPTNVTVVDAGANPLPAAVDLSAPGNEPSTTWPSSMERFEGMRVTIPSFTVTAPNLSNSFANVFIGDFFGVVTGTPRPFREAGIPLGDPIPASNVPYAGPIFDNEPELLRVKTTILTGSTELRLRAGTELSNVTGVVDFNFGRYSILPDIGTLDASNIVPGTVPEGTMVADQTTREFTVAAFNLQNFTESSLDTPRMKKASLAIRDYLRNPDVLALIEVSSQGGTLGLLADQISQDAIAAGQPDPEYVGYILGTGTQETAFLIKTATIGGVSRVQLDGALNDALQEYGDNTVPVICPDDGNPMTPPVPATNGQLLDRPPLALMVTIHAANGDVYPVTVINLHLKSLNDVDSTAANNSDPNGDGERYACAPPSPGFATIGERYRAKRQQGAEFVANLVEMLQTNDPSESILLVGDFNAYEFNDGYADILATIKGEAFADDQTIVPNDGVDLVTRNLEDLYVYAPASEFYSYTYGGLGQQLDHAVANDQIILNTDAIRVERPRINADFLVADGSDETTPLRVSDHDPVVAFFEVGSFGSLPVISAIVDQTTNEDIAKGPIAFTISDAEDGTSILCTDVAGTSDNQSIVADANIAISGTGQSCDVTLTPVAEASGTAAITLTLTDSDNDVGTMVFDLQVDPVNDAPVISTSVSPTTASENVLYQYTPGATDVDGPGEIWSVMAGTDTCGGSFNSGTYEFTPAEASSGSTCTLAIQVCDDHATDEQCDTQSAVITITATDDPAVLTDDTLTVDEDAPATAIDVLGNDVDPDSPLLISGFTSPAKGTVVVTGGGTGLTYEPNADYCNDGVSTDDFTYTANGQTANVQVTVNCQNDDAVAADDSATVTQNSSGNVIDVLANDTADPDFALSIDSVDATSAQGGTLGNNGSQITYTPANGFCGATDTFSYTLVGGSSATVTVTVDCLAAAIFADGFED